MLEYETANPGQDRAKPEGEHFNPDEHTDKAVVSFAPDEYAMEEGLRMRSDSGAMELNGAGDPVEYGRRQRPFSNSPAPPHPNDQYAGLDGGMHSHELQPRYNPHNSIGADSERTVVVPTANPSTHANTGDGFQRNAVVGTPIKDTRSNPILKASSIRNATPPSSPPRATGNVKSNTYYNRNIGSGPDDDEFFDKN
jgi:aquaporin related protein